MKTRKLGVLESRAVRGKARFCRGSSTAIESEGRWNGMGK